jgi:hypothetical protein
MAFGDEPRQMLKVTQHFSKHCRCHLQGKHVMEGPYIWHAVGCTWDMTDLIGGGEKQVAIQFVMSM